MDSPADFMRFVTQVAEDGVNFEGNVVALASAARNGDNDAVTELIRAHAALAVLTGIRLRPAWLPKEDAAQEAMLVLRSIVESGSERIAAELPGAIEARFAALEKPSDDD